MNKESEDCKCFTHEKCCGSQSNNSDLLSGERNMMKRRNADPGKLRRPVPVKRTKIITEGMHGNSMLYLRFVMLWAVVVLADHMMEFRFEFLWPLWMMIRTVYFSFKYEGLTFSVIFICVALTSDVICFFFIPLQYIFFAASTYVWVQYVWNTFAEKGVCAPTIALMGVVVWAEGALRASSARPPPQLCRPLAAHTVGYPIFTLGITLNQYVRHVLLLQRQRLVAVQEIYQILKTAPPTAQTQEQSHESKTTESSTETVDSRPMNGSARRKKMVNGNSAVMDIHDKLEFLAKHLENQMARTKSSTAHTTREPRFNDLEDNLEPCKMTASANLHLLKPKYFKRESFTRRCYRNRDKDKENGGCLNVKSTEQTKEQIIKDNNIESTKELVKEHKNDSTDGEELKKDQQEREKEPDKDREHDKEKDREHDKEKDREHDKEKERQHDKEKEREQREKEKEKEKEREREKEWERVQKAARECAEELRKARMELAAAKISEAEAKVISDQALKKQASWRFEKTALERKLNEERRARTQAENSLRNQQPKNSSECENESCKSRWRSSHSETVVLRRDLQRAREKTARLHHDLAAAADQVHRDQVRAQESAAELGAAQLASLRERVQHLEAALSAETRVKLDLLSALGDARRQLAVRDNSISKQEKELEELKAQIFAVMPPGIVSKNSSPKFRVPDGSPLDPNATVYTPKQLCSDA